MKNKDNLNGVFTTEDEIELQELEAQFSGLFADLELPPLRQDFQAELRKKISTKENKMDAARGKRKSFFSSLTMAKKKIKAKSAFSFNSNSGSGRRNLRLAAAFLLVVFVFTGIFYGLGDIFVKPALAGEISIVALQEDTAGIATDTSFLLTSENPLDKRTVEENLQINPAFPYRLERENGGKQYKIIPQEALKANTVYQLGFDTSGQGRESFSWAFQTKGQFRVLSSLPRRNSTGVPINTGLEIVFSHENFSAEEAAKYFTISPEVKGKFEKHKKTLVFVPETPLLYGQIYTVTLKKGFPLSSSDQVIAEDYQFTFETEYLEEDRTQFNFDIYEKQLEFSTQETPHFSLNFHWQGQIPKAQVEVFRYPDSNSFVESQAKLNEIPSWAYYTRNSYREDFSKLGKYKEFTVDVINTDSYTHYLVFPEDLPAGLYGAQITMDKAVQQVWFQVSDLAVYLTQGRESSLFWVNNLKTGQPEADAKITVSTLDKNWSTDAKGTAFIEERFIDYPGGFAVVEKGGQLTVVDLRSPFVEKNYSEEEYNLTRDYWKYLYLDRKIYQPGDTVNYWGILSPRFGAKAIDEVTIELYSYSYFRPYYMESDNSAIVEQQVKVDGQTFTGEMGLPILRPGYYSLRVKSGDTVLTSNSFTVETYTKPAYELTIEKDKKAIFTGEKMNFQVKAAFFEGTPVPNLKLKYYIDGREGTVVTDDKGMANIPYVGKGNDGYSSPSYVHLYVTASLPEAGEIEVSSSVCLFSGRVDLECQALRQDTAYSLQLDTKKIDLTKVNQGEFLSRDSYITGPAPNTTVTGRIMKEIWTKEEVGQYYDFINKKVEKTYHYRYSVQEMGEFTTVTGSDGKITYQGQLDDPEATYYIELSTRDGAGGLTRRTVCLYSRSYNSNPGYSYFYLKNERNTGHNEGETVQLKFMENEQELGPRASSFLYYQAQKELITYSVKDDGQYSFTFTEEMNPNITVGGVYFDGRGYQETYPLIVGVAKESKALNVSITSDKEEYRPGEKVKLAVEVKDLQGKPVKAEVNLNLVDEALFNLAEQHVNLLDSIYGDYIHPQLSSLRTHLKTYFGGGAEQGGEGGGERSDFRDTVIFETLKTGRDGKATTEFTLPDNLTSWRVTYHALTDNLMVASGTEQIAVRLPFFVDVTMNNSYHLGDKPVLILRSYGKKLSEGQEVTYQTVLKTPKGQEIKGSGQGLAFTPFDWELPVLEEGVYTLTVTGKWGSYTDTITKELIVQKPYLERSRTEFSLLSEKLELQGSDKYPTKLVFTDYEKSQYLTGLYDLAWTFGSRIEQKLAAREAEKLLKEYFPENDLASLTREEESFIQYQQEDGGISLLPYSDSELALSALVASASPEDFDTRALAGYFYNILEGDESQEDDKSLALWGLASLKEPVLLQVKNELQRDDLQPAEKIHLALALLELGEGAYGQTVFQDILTRYGQELGDTMRIKGPRDQDEILVATTQMALLAARLDAPEKGKLYQYILENPGKEILNTIEKLQILKYSLKYMNPDPVSFTYQYNGKTEKVSLKDWESFQLTLLPAEMAEIKFSQISGKVGVSALYKAPLLGGEVSKGEDLSLSRSYKVDNKNTVQFQRGDLVKVTLEYSIGDKAPAGSYEIVDILPAGLAYISRPYQRNIKEVDISYASEVNNQQLTFHVWKDKGQISYYAKVLTPGDYECGAPYLGNIESREIYITGSTDKVKIK